MSAHSQEPAAGAGGPQAGAAAGEPSEEELRAAYEAELSRLSTTDMIAQAAVSLLNLGARRMAPPSDDREPGEQQPADPQRDLEQARDAIDAVRSLLEILERRIPQELPPLRDALSRLQMAYAREVGPAAATPAQEPSGVPAGAAGQPVGSGQDRAGGDRAPAGEQRPPGPGPAESSGRLWVPGR